MANTEQILKAVVQAELKRKLSQDKVRKATEALGQESVNIILERTLANRDFNNKKFRAYSPKYSKWKARWIARKLKSRKGGSYNYGKLFPNVATEMPSFMRLTGEMLAGLNYSVLQFAQFNVGQFNSSVRLYLATEKSKKKTEWNEQQGRKWFGINTRSRNEMNRLKDVYLKALGLRKVTSAKVQ